MKKSNFWVECDDLSLYKIRIWSCLKGFKTLNVHIPPYRKALGIWNLGPKMTFFGIKDVFCRIFYRNRNFYLIFFWKVWMILYILCIYHIGLTWVLPELRASENTRKITIFQQNPYKKSTSGFTELTVKSNGMLRFTIVLLDSLIESSVRNMCV